MVPRTKAGVVHWKRMRKVVMTRCGGLCEKCRLARARQVHHLTYARFNKEKARDLLALCGRCHMAVHGLGPGGKPTTPRRHKMSTTVAGAKRAAARARAMLRAIRRQEPPIDKRESMG